MAIYGSLGEVNVGALSATTADNAVDVFVYDTRKDSDGGQWRKRTQHTSWYNETLNTATRGSRRDFPAVAVIVSSTSPNRVTIYDADDPDMPMWMVFTSNVNQFGAIFNNRSAVSIVAVNGSIIWADSLDSVVDVSFIKDNYTSTASSGSWDSLRNIIDRNPIDTNNLWIRYNPTRYVVSYPINDVAMTVLPNAPIDGATGLPVPTIAAATNGGVSVIRDDGTVSNLTYSSVATQTVTFDKNNGLWVCFGGGGSSIGWYYYTNFTTTSSLQLIYHNNSGWSGSYDMLDGVIYRGIAYSYSNISTGTNGLSNFTGFGALKASTTMSNFITTSYNTGWMHGDIKGAWLSDTSTASVSGTELVTNGTFDTDTSGWTTNGSTLSISSNKLVVTITSAYGYAYQSVPTVIGKTYTLSFSYFRSAGQPNPWVYLGNVSHTAMVYGERLTDSSAEVFEQITFVATTTTAFIVLRVNGTTTGNFATFDNVSLRLADPDRSVNNKGLQVFGTITKTPVATGSNLVAYGGFTASNYLQQPTNSALSFGTNPFSIMMWFKTPTGGTGTEVLISWRDLVGSNPLWQIYLNSTSSISFDFQGSQNGGATFNNPLRDNTWHLLTAVQRSASLREFYIDSNLVATNTTTLSPGFSIENAVLRVGTHYDSNYAYTGSLSLLRVSASAPSPEQIRKIYEDEKALFQPNSQCTLYGSSDAVTALAYDDTYQILSVGTSSGRSDFRGLERINNTTTAVTTAISASNGLIAEQ